MATMVTGELKEGLLGQLFEIQRQIRQAKGYPFDPQHLRSHLQKAIEGRFTKPALVYPGWVREHLTPELEATDFRDPGGTELWLDPRQTSGDQRPTGHEVYEVIKANGFLERSLSYDDLKFLEANPDQIPAEFHGKWIYAWASVLRDDDGKLRVPDLHCDVGSPYVDWSWLDDGWDGDEPAGFRLPAQAGK